MDVLVEKDSTNEYFFMNPHLSKDIEQLREDNLQKILLDDNDY